MSRVSITLVLLLGLTLAVVTSCQTEVKEKKQQIAVIPKGTNHEFWKSIHAGAKRAATELGIDVIWKGPVKEDNREEQIKVVESFINLGVSGIVLAPLDNTALRAPVNDATRSGIPVVIIDSGLESDVQVSFVATNNYQGGVLAGEHLAKIINNTGNVIMLRYQEGSASTMERERGFVDAISKVSGIKVVSSNQYAGATTESAYQASENLLSSFKNEAGELQIAGIFTPCEPVTFGMLRALRDGGFAGKVKLIGFDTSDKMVEALKLGDISALVLQDPEKMGYLGVKTLHAHLSGQKVPKLIDTGVSLITSVNMNEPEKAALLHPPRA